MEAGLLSCVGLGWWAAASAVQWASAALARAPRPEGALRHRPADFSIVAPMNGVEDASPAYVTALEELARQGAEVLICVSHADDGAVAATRAGWREAPILVGNDTTFNPKMNNVRKGLEAAGRPVVALCDAGILLDGETLCRAAAPLSETVGLVLALKAGEDPVNFAADFERAYINGHQARFLLAADRLGIAVASGGVTLMTHETLQRIGNWRGFNRWIADDYSVTRSVRELGLQTRLGAVMPRLRLSRRDWPAVWSRQVRWARTRLRLPVWPLVLWEPAVGWAVSGVAGLVGLAAAGFGPGALLTGLLLHTAGWLAAEAWFLQGQHLAFGPRAAAAAMVREVLAPLLMLRALGANRLARHRSRRSMARPLTCEWCSGDFLMNATPNGITTIMLPERMDSVTASTVEQTLQSALTRGAKLIIDGSAVTYMSAAGVRALAGLLHAAEALGAHVVFCRFSGPAADCLDVSGFSQLLDVADNMEDAAARLEPHLARSTADGLRRRGAAG